MTCRSKSCLGRESPGGRPSIMTAAPRMSDVLSFWCNQGVLAKGKIVFKSSSLNRSMPPTK
jgi:hypothetical protein